MANNVPFIVQRPKEALAVQAIDRSTPLERRSKIRYPVTLKVRYRTIGRSHRIAGMGQTLNMSSGGLLIHSDQRAELGTRIELNIEWPSMLDGQIPLQLVAVGKVVRLLESGFALSFTQYQFRTMSRKLQATPAESWDPAEQVMVRSAGA